MILRLALLMTLCCVSCVARPTQPKPKTGDDDLRYWTPIYFGGHSFSFENDRTEATAIDFIPNGGASLTYGSHHVKALLVTGRGRAYREFLIDGRLHEFSPRSLLWVYNTVAGDDAWHYHEDGLTIRWRNPHCPAILERGKSALGSTPVPGSARRLHLGASVLDLSDTDWVIVAPRDAATARPGAPESGKPESAKPAAEIQRFRRPVELEFDTEGKLVEPDAK